MARTESADEQHKDAIRQELGRILASPPFVKSDRLARFLRFTVEMTLEGRTGELKESTIGVEVYGREPDYSPKTDAIVRVEARRLRGKLMEFREANSGACLIDLPKGTYVPILSATRKQTVVKEGPPSEKPSRRRWWIAVAVASTLVLGGAVLFFMARPRSYPFTSRIFTALPGFVRFPAFSPDGKRLAFSWKEMIQVTPLDGDQSVTLTQSDRPATAPAWSPDGKWIAFVRRTKADDEEILRIPAEGGTEQKICSISLPESIPGIVDWSPDGRVLLASDQGAPGGVPALTLIKIADGSKRKLVAPPAESTGDLDAKFSSDGKRIAFRRDFGDELEDVFVLSLDTMTPRRVTSDQRGIYGIAWEPDGNSLIVGSQRAGSMYSLWRFYLDNGVAPERLTTAGVEALLPAVSRDGRRIAYVTRQVDVNLWRIARDGNPTPTMLASSTVLDTSPQYSPDGRWISFRSTRSGSDEVWIARADGTSPRRVTHFDRALTGCARWSPDSRFLVFDSRLKGNGDVFIVDPFDSHATPRALTTDPTQEVVASWSADGRAVYFASNRTGTWEVFRQDVAAGTPIQVTRGGGFMAFEDRTGRYLYYSKSEGGGIWRMALPSGSPEKVVDALRPEMWGNWALSPHGIYWMDFTGEGNPVVIRFQPFGGKARDLYSLPRPPVRWDAGLTVSPDEHWVLFSQIDLAGSNIALLERAK